MSRGRAALSTAQPFPGLRPFGFEDHQFFFGRDDQIQRLYRLLEFGHFIAVVGSSGSGKSSLVRAGLLPLLAKENQEAGSRHWRWVEMRPGTSPLRSLAAALSSVDGPPADDPAQLAIESARRERINFVLRSSSFGLVEILGELEDYRGQSVIILVDQFEELFRYTSSGDHGTPLPSIKDREVAAHFVQLLLEASRAAHSKLHIIITTRSDFIGDCSLFEGLPEAVSSSQFLVPSLARDQREEIIRRPIEASGAAINPGLVERLLNDASDELDQLPVLQHCLKRLWEHAGRTQRQEKVAGAESGSSDGTPGQSRYIDFDDYNAIGRISGALSQHADEVLQSLRGLETAVEQTFRALADFDRDGRTVRRALRFSKLVDEAGVPEDDLRLVVDRFRSDDCSFLMPSKAAAPTIMADTGIDVGHEALLRNWSSLSSEVIPNSNPPKPGWLRAEAEDGRTYRALLALAETAPSDNPATIPLNQVEARWNWWRARPRTRAWADRYGGQFDRVNRLLVDSREALNRDIAAREKAEHEKALWFRAIVATAVALGVALVGVGFLWQSARLATQRAEQASQTAERSFAINTDFTSRIAEIIQEEDAAGRVSVAVKRRISELASGALSDFGDLRHTPEIVLLQVKWSTSMADALVNLGDNETAFEIVDKISVIAEKAFNDNPENSQVAAALSSIYTRLGIFLNNNGKTDDAIEKLVRGSEIDKNLSDRDPNNLVTFADIVISTNPEAALSKYQEALQVRAELAKNDPSSSERQQNLAASYVRVGIAFRKMGRLEEALESYRSGMGIIETLIEKDPTNNIWQSNYSATSRRIGDILVEQEKYDEALTHYDNAIQVRLDLVERDRSNVRWKNWLALAYEYAGKALLAGGYHSDAVGRFSDANKIWADLVKSDPEDDEWQVKRVEGWRNMTEARLGLADSLAGAGDAEGALREYRAVQNIYLHLSKNGEAAAEGADIQEVQDKILDLCAGRSDTECIEARMGRQAE